MRGWQDACTTQCGCLGREHTKCRARACACRRGWDGVMDVASSGPVRALAAGVISEPSWRGKSCRPDSAHYYHEWIAGMKCSYARLPQVANYNDEVSWVAPTRVMRPKPL